MKVERRWKSSPSTRENGWGFYQAKWKHVCLQVVSKQSWDAPDQRWIGSAMIGRYRLSGPWRKRPELAQRDAEALVPVLLCNLRDATARLLKSAGIDPEPQAPDGKD